MSADNGLIFREWEQLSGSDFETIDRSRTVVVVACSPLEVHGPHLPVVTDNLEARALARRAAELLHESHPEVEFLHMPPLYVAADVVPQRGSVLFRTSTIIRVLEDLGRSLCAQGFRNIWVTSFHGGPRHFVSIEAACERVNRRHGGRMVSMFSLLLNRLTGGSTDLSEVLGHLDGVSQDDLVGDTHGGAVETSMMLHLMGEHVKTDYDTLPQRTLSKWLDERGEGGKPTGSGRPSLLKLVLSFRSKLLYFVDESYAGHPAVATAELGERMIEELAGLAAEALSELWRGELAPRDCHSPLWPVRWVFLSETVKWAFERVMGFKNSVF